MQVSGTSVPEVNVEEEGVGDGGEDNETEGPGDEMLHRVGDRLAQVAQYIPKLAWHKKTPMLYSIQLYSRVYIQEVWEIPISFSLRGYKKKEGERG